jgi:NADPH:quinone reductase-like Zn-dependent oxidoreductase
MRVMRAVVVEEFRAEPELVELRIPEPGPGEMLVRIHAAGLNPFDWKVADGALDGVVDHAFPLVLGSDGAGVVEQVGPDVADFRPGDRVFGQFMRLPHGQGSYADYALVAVDDKVAAIPETLAFNLAAALPTASLTAYQAIQAARLEPGQTILVNGASGGVGQSAVQFAANAGAHVLATAPPELGEHLRALGAAEVIDFTVAPTSEQVLVAHPGGVDAVLDLVTTAEGANPMGDLLRPGGVLVSTNGAAHPDALAGRGLRGVDLYNRPTREDLEVVAGLADAGKLQVTIEAEVALADAPAAVARARSRHAAGKTVILP